MPKIQSDREIEWAQDDSWTLSHSCVFFLLLVLCLWEKREYVWVWELKFNPTHTSTPTQAPTATPTSSQNPAPSPTIPEVPYWHSQ